MTNRRIYVGLDIREYPGCALRLAPMSRPRTGQNKVDRKGSDAFEKTRPEEEPRLRHALPLLLLLMFRVICNRCMIMIVALLMHAIVQSAVG